MIELNDGEWNFLSSLCLSCFFYCHKIESYINHILNINWCQIKARVFVESDEEITFYAVSINVVISSMIVQETFCYLELYMVHNKLQGTFI